MAMPAESDSANADELLEMLNSGLGYIRLASVQRLRTKTTAELLALPVAMSCRVNFALACWAVWLGAMLQTMRCAAARPKQPLCGRC